MCTFCSDLPSNERAGAKKAFITMFLKPNDPNNEKERYRFRILNFRLPSKNDRAYPFISRYVHNHWGVNENGLKVVDDVVVCPSTSYIDAKNDMSLGFVDTYKELKLKDKKATWDNICPMCRQVASAWNAYKSSGKTDKLSLDRIFSMKKQFQGVVPVYVVHDPINEKNTGRFKCIIFSNQDEYKQFIELVNRERAKISTTGGTYNWCNGTNAVDFFIRVDKVPVIYNEGKPNEKHSFVRKITKMSFGQKPYDIIDDEGREIITKDAIDKFEFDDQYYVKNTKTEIEDFYKKHFSLMSRNIPDEDIDGLDDGTTAQPISTKRVQNSSEQVKIPQNIKPQTGITPSAAALVNDLMDDPDDIPFDNPPAAKTESDDDDEPTSEAAPQSVDDLLNQLDFND